ncbi:hypothetical protein [Mucilaginibacter sp.]|jgi:hypothetical protein|uniref:hypothetical protein n=1 Tax=Mucilaginibacter sp. TaxID=1882438 RepID=UPI002604152B|nr:hypothetical protein [Mucilaginibacter sp.]MDB5129926.1 hypothetical protein [Mucilaginibacter sp.]
MNTKDTLDLILNGVQLLFVVIGGVWAYFRFRRENPLHPRIEFGLKCKFYGPIHSSYLATFTIIANNKGNVEHRFSEIRLKIRGIKGDEDLTVFEKYAPMVEFPEKIIDKVNIVPPQFGYFFVRPGVNQSFNYPTQISKEIRYIIVRATFKYQLTNDLHTTEEVFEVKEML